MNKLDKLFASIKERKALAEAARQTLEQKKREYQESQEAMNRAANGDDLEAYQRAKKDAENKADLVEMAEAKLKRISAEEVSREEVLIAWNGYIKAKQADYDKLAKAYTNARRELFAKYMVPILNEADELNKMKREVYGLIKYENIGQVELPQVFPKFENRATLNSTLNHIMNNSDMAFFYRTGTMTEEEETRASNILLG